MINKTLLAGALLLSASCYAQKASNKTFTVHVTAEPVNPLPQNTVIYGSEIITPISPLSRKETGQAGSELETVKKGKLQEMAKTSLKLPNAKFIACEPGSRSDWFITLTTSDVKVTSMNEKPLSELSQEDEVFRYAFSAVLSVKDANGELLLEKVLAKPEEEQKMIKGAMFFDPLYRTKMNLHKNNPEKLKILNDEILKDKNHLILAQVTDQAGRVLEEHFVGVFKTINVSIFSVKGKQYQELSAMSDKIFDTYAKYRAFSKKNRIPKEGMDKVMREGIQLWEKYLIDPKELEEKAVKGLTLNCAVASCWLGETDKASAYLDRVPEAIKDDSGTSGSDDDDDGSPPPVGATVLLSFEQSAQNARQLNEVRKTFGSRMTFNQ